MGVNRPEKSNNNPYGTSGLGQEANQMASVSNAGKAMIAMNTYFEVAGKALKQYLEFQTQMVNMESMLHSLSQQGSSDEQIQSLLNTLKGTLNQNDLNKMVTDPLTGKPISLGALLNELQDALNLKKDVDDTKSIIGGFLNHIDSYFPNATTLLDKSAIKMLKMRLPQSHAYMFAMALQSYTSAHDGTRGCASKWVEHHYTAPLIAFQQCVNGDDTLSHFYHKNTASHFTNNCYNANTDEEQAAFTTGNEVITKLGSQVKVILTKMKGAMDNLTGQLSSMQTVATNLGARPGKTDN